MEIWIITAIAVIGYGLFGWQLWENRRLHRLYQLQGIMQLDALTGICNPECTARLCQDYLEKKPQGELCVLMKIDVDSFAEINEVYGRQLGDDALRTMGQILTGIFRDRDILGRVGGDEFIVCMKAVKDEKIVSRRANDIIAKFRQQMHEIGIDSASCSIGVSMDRTGQRGYVDLYNRADQALFSVKQGGKGAVVIK